MPTMVHAQLKRRLKRARS